MFSQEMEVECYLRAAQTHSQYIYKKQKQKGRQFVSRLGTVFQET
jgi:hypothetical protein